MQFASPEKSAVDGPLTEAEERFAAGVVRRKTLFLALSLAGIGVAALLAVFYGYRKLVDPTYPIALRVVVVILILLNARQNLRQYRYARVLEKIGRWTTDRAGMPS